MVTARLADFAWLPVGAAERRDAFLVHEANAAVVAWKDHDPDVRRVLALVERKGLPSCRSPPDTGCGSGRAHDRLCPIEPNATVYRRIATNLTVSSGYNYASGMPIDGRISVRDRPNVVCLDVRPERNASVWFGQRSPPQPRSLTS